MLIDCPPSLGPMTVNALVAADRVIVPVQTEYFALEGLAQVLETIALSSASSTRACSVAGMVLTMHDARTRLGRDVERDVREHFPGLVFDTVIPRNIRLSEAPSFGVPVTLHDPYLRRVGRLRRARARGRRAVASCAAATLARRRRHERPARDRAVAAGRRSCGRPRGMGRARGDHGGLDDPTAASRSSARSRRADLAQTRASRAGTSMTTTLAALAESMRTRGVLQPVLVGRSPGGRFELIAGERRWRAAQARGPRADPALVGPATTPSRSSSR